MDFRKPTAIGARIGQDDEQLRFGHGIPDNRDLGKHHSAQAKARHLHEVSSFHWLRFSLPAIDEEWQDIKSPM